MTMTNFLSVRCRYNTNPASSVLSVVFVLLLLVLSNVVVTVVTVVDAQAAINNYCGNKPCIEAIQTPCEEIIETHKFQGSCCSMESVPQTRGCRVTVAFGNCFWYPFCDDCDELDMKEGSKCNNIFETDADQQCPAGDFDPLAIQSDPTWSWPSCAPSMAPTNSSMVADNPSGGTSTTTATTTKTRAAVLAAFIATAVFAAA